jgi:aminodeoxychorismate synthase component I
LPAGDRFRFASGDGARSVFGAAPVAVLSSRIEEEDAREDPLLRAKLRALLPRIPPMAQGSFPGGAVGFIGYERGYALEGLSPRMLSRPGPDLYFAIYDTFAVWHPEVSEVEVVSWGLREDGAFDDEIAHRRARELEERLRDASSQEEFAGEREAAFSRGRYREQAHVPGRSDLGASSPPTSLSEGEHALAVQEILQAIRRGDIYQANLTRRFNTPYFGDPVLLFERLLSANPSPHAAYLEAGEVIVISSSPERLLSVQGRNVESRPIKGTAPRHSQPHQDRAAAAALLASQKDQAELVMITDLLRNDLGKVCEFGSVRVPQLRELESYSHVHHLVSTIRGRLRPEHDALDALAAVFPCGSITGAPKRRAMEILRELEPQPRDVYTGTVGWMGFDRSSHWSVAIRTGILADGILSYGAGGGIVIDSRAEAEWQELLWKARAFTDAVEWTTAGTSAGRCA